MLFKYVKFDEKSEYFKRIAIRNIETDSILCMEKNRTISIKPNKKLDVIVK